MHVSMNVRLFSCRSTRMDRDHMSLQLAMIEAHSAICINASQPLDGMRTDEIGRYIAI